MLRLRTTAGLSLLALAVGIGGTAWLSAQTVGWAGPAARIVAVAPVRHHGTSASAHRVRRMTPHAVSRVAGVVRPSMALAAVAAPAGAAPPPELVPIAMPAASVPYEAMRGHLDGRVLLHLTLDAGGWVTAAALAASSGDPLLDAHALDIVRQWRFAVPADHPGGFSGDLPMRFTGDDRRLAQAH